MKIHHIGYLVKKIDKSIEEFEGLGYVIVKKKLKDTYRKIEICFLEKDGYLMELISPMADDSVVSDLMKKIGNTPYHICYEVDNIELEIEKLRHNNYILCNEIHTAIALDNKKICFMINPYIGMIELVEKISNK